MKTQGRETLLQHFRPAAALAGADWGGESLQVLDRGERMSEIVA